MNRFIIFCLLFVLLPGLETLAGQPKAMVLEFEDSFTRSTGATWILERTGFSVSDINPSRTLSLGGTDLLLFGSFSSEAPEYKNFIQTNKAQILEFVRNGGVLLQLAQADQTENSPDFLPPQLRATRGDDDFSDVFRVGGPHTLIEALPLLGDQVLIPSNIKHGVLWDALNSQSGFRVVLASQSGKDYGILEGAYGEGRIVLCSLFLDKLLQQKKPSSDSQVLADADIFFNNIKRYVEAVRQHIAPDVIPSSSKDIAAFTKLDNAQDTKKKSVDPSPQDKANPQSRELEAPKTIETNPVPPFIKGSWTLVALPDTQHYDGSNASIFSVQTKWIADNAEKRDIRYVLHLGDLVNNNLPRQWENAAKAMSLLDGHVPYAIVPGNHDYGDNGDANNRQTYLNEYFPPSKFAKWPTFGGTMEDGKMDNSYHTFRVNNQEWLILALEWAPSDEVVDWANRIVDNHPQDKVILITHAYLYQDNYRYDRRRNQRWAPHGNNVNDGEALWEKLVSKHPGFALVLCGHVMGKGVGRLASWGKHGNVVHQILSNYQTRNQGGEGYLRLLEFLPESSVVQIKTYSPYLDRYLTDEENQFTIDLNEPQH